MLARGSIEIKGVVVGACLIEIGICNEPIRSRQIWKINALTSEAEDRACVLAHWSR